jgi:hypothetical protein
MQGSIRTFIGLILVMGAAGGLDNATDSQLFPLVALAIAGLGLMAAGISAMKSVK